MSVHKEVNKLILKSRSDNFITDQFHCIYFQTSVTSISKPLWKQRNNCECYWWDI